MELTKYFYYYDKELLYARKSIKIIKESKFPIEKKMSKKLILSI